MCFFLHVILFELYVMVEGELMTVGALTYEFYVELKWVLCNLFEIGFSMCGLKFES